MPAFLLVHRHPPEECGPVFAAWAGFESCLRGTETRATCARAVARGNRSPEAHEIWWEVEAPDESTALALLPEYVAARTTVREVSEVRIP